MTDPERLEKARCEIQQVLNKYQVNIKADPENYGGYASIWLCVPGADYFRHREGHLKVIDDEWKSTA